MRASLAGVMKISSTVDDGWIDFFLFPCVRDFEISRCSLNFFLIGDSVLVWKAKPSKKTASNFFVGVMRERRE